MTAETVKTLATLYFQHTELRNDLGMPLSLADHLAWCRERKLPLDELSSIGIPLVYYEALKQAVDEGVSDQELHALCTVRLPQRNKDGTWTFE